MRLLVVVLRATGVYDDRSGCEAQLTLPGLCRGRGSFDRLDGVAPAFCLSPRPERPEFLLDLFDPLQMCPEKSPTERV